MPPEILFSPYGDRLSELINHSLERGVTFSTPQRIADHYRLTKKVDSMVSTSDSEMTITSINKNDMDIEGLTYVLDLPFTNANCEYTTDNAKIYRSYVRGMTCRVYATVDINANENVTFTVMPGS